MVWSIFTNLITWSITSFALFLSDLKTVLFLVRRYVATMNLFISRSTVENDFIYDFLL